MCKTETKLGILNLFHNVPKWIYNIYFESKFELKIQLTTYTYKLMFILEIKTLNYIFLKIRPYAFIILIFYLLIIVISYLK